MLVVNTSPQLSLAFPDDGNKGMTITRKRLTQVPSPGGDQYGMIVAETPPAGDKEAHRLLSLIEAKPKSYVIVAPGPLLQQTAAEIQALGRALSSPVSKPSSPSGPTSAGGTDASDGDFLDGFVQKKLRAFVHAFSASGGKNLYDCLMKEVMRPLILFALEETRGNQRRAAELLGLNRNTLRKHIQECRIALNTTRTRRSRSR